jgi:hypothetical protein
MTGGVLTIGRLIVTASRAARQAVPEAEPHAGTAQVSTGTHVRASRKTRPMEIRTEVPFTGQVPGRSTDGPGCGSQRATGEHSPSGPNVADRA